MLDTSTTGSWAHELVAQIYYLMDFTVFKNNNLLMFSRTLSSWTARGSNACAFLTQLPVHYD